MLKKNPVVYGTVCNVLSDQGVGWPGEYLLVLCSTILSFILPSSNVSMSFENANKKVFGKKKKKRKCTKNP